MQKSTAQKVTLISILSLTLIWVVLARPSHRKSSPRATKPENNHKHTFAQPKSIHTFTAAQRHEAIRRSASRPTSKHPSGHHKKSRRKPHPEVSVGPATHLMITDLRVVEDSVRTNPNTGRRATWTFKYLMENMAGDNDPEAFTLEWLKHWETDQLVNDQVSPARPSIRELVIDPWLAASGGERLDLRLAPFKLLAIVNRMDLRVHDQSSVTTGGEGRFVFGVLNQDGTPLPPIAGPAPGGFTVIFEYELVTGDMSGLEKLV